MQNIERNETGIVEVIDAHSIPNHVVTLVQSALKYSVNKHMRKHQTTQMRVQHCKWKCAAAAAALQRGGVAVVGG